MGRSIQTDNSTVVSAFHQALAHQFLLILGLFAVLAVGFNVFRTLQYRHRRAAAVAVGAGAGTPPDAPGTTPTGASPMGSATPGATPARAADRRRGHAAGAASPEPPGRRILRFGFGALWLLDGLLQLQSSMPLGLPGGVVQPAAAGSPDWVRHVVDSGLTIWNNHPVQAAAASVWIQLGLGLWLLVAPRGRWSRAGGLATAGWGLVVWAFGEAFGGIFAPGASWLFGAPGAVLFYCAAGLLLALPESTWRTPTLGRRILQVMGAFFVGMGVLQAWPGRGFWQGHTPQGSGSLSAMVTQMAQTPQPHTLSSLVSSFGHFDSAHGWGVNLFVVLALIGVGAALLSGRATLARPALWAALVLCLADWMLVEDFGFFGGTGTDPNSMLPVALLLVGGYVAMVRVPETARRRVPSATPTLVLPLAPAPGTEPADAPGAGLDEPGGRRGWDSLAPSYLIRVAAALGALIVVLVGTAPMTLAATNPTADPILAEALNGTPNVTDSPAPDFHLVDQRGDPVSLSSLHGRVVALTFLDPVCTSDCPLIAQDFRLADARLGSAASKVDFVAVVANPIYRSVSFTRAFDQQEGMDALPNWLYLTGSPAALTQTWDNYGIEVAPSPAGAMVAHSDLAYIIDADGHTRSVLDSSPSPGATYASSFASLLVDQITQVLPS